MTKQKQQALLGLKKAQGTISKIIEMTENDIYCIDIMQQNLAVVGLLKAAHTQLFENHLKTCFQSALKTRNEAKKNKMIKEILKVTKLFNK
jgi:DNA-binding FrmR family transcriptional regulator